MIKGAHLISTRPFELFLLPYIVYFIETHQWKLKGRNVETDTGGWGLAFFRMGINLPFECMDTVSVKFTFVFPDTEDVSPRVMYSELEE